MLPLLSDQPPPCPITQTDLLYTPPSLLAEPGSNQKLSGTCIQSTHTCAILARSTERVGSLTSPILLTLQDCHLNTDSKAPIFLISNARAEIKLTNCHANATDKHLLSVQEGIWGTPGFNAGCARITAVNSTLKGNIYVGKHCKVELTLASGSSWHGHFTGPGQATLNKHPHAVWVQYPHEHSPHSSPHYAILEKKSQ